MTASLRALVVGLGLCLGCGAPTETVAPPPLDRSKAVWIGRDGLQLGWLGAIAHAGVDQLVIPSASAAALDLPELRSALPEGLELYAAVVDEGSVGANVAAARKAVGGEPAGLILDHPGDGTGLASRIADLRAELGVPIRLLLHPEQLGSTAILEAVDGSDGVVILLEGHLAAVRPGSRLPSEPPWRTLEPLMDRQTPVAAAWVLDPRVEPALAGWGDDPDALIEGGNAELDTSAETGFGFRIRRDVEWSGRSIADGQVVHLEWLDAAALDRSIADFEHLPRLLIDGFHFIHLPPPAPVLGLSRQGLLGYLNGELPEPRLEIRVERRGGTVSVVARNPSVFASAPSVFDNWVEIHTVNGSTIFRGEGDFDGVRFGTRGAHGEIDSKTRRSIDTVRFAERFVAPGEEIAAPPVRISPANAEIEVRWQLILGNGERVGGIVRD